jgi:hypothetical protein
MQLLGFAARQKLKPRHISDLSRLSSGPKAALYADVCSAGHVSPVGQRVIISIKNRSGTNGLAFAWRQ